MEVRRATEAGAGLLARSDSSVQALHAVAHPRPFMAVPDRRAVEEWLATLIARPDAAALIGTVAGEAVGYCAGFVRQYRDYPFRNRLTIGIDDQLVIESAARGHGCGRRFLGVMIADRRACGAERSELSAGACKAGTPVFYRRLGLANAHQQMALEW